jgi:hypothetical protein
METYPFASLAQVRVLMLPVGSITRSAFDKYTSEIRTFSDIRLGDIPADGKDDRGELSGLFSPNHSDVQLSQLVSCQTLCPQAIFI